MTEQIQTAVPPGLPALKGQYGPGGIGRWYAGDVPPGADEKPLLVFVPGLGDSALTWWGKSDGYGDNDMYAQAYAAGYRTAFVSFDAPITKPGTMWRNGQMLSWQLKRICAHFGVRSAVLIAHSKGGVDCETAVREYGADKNAEKIITLSSPHWGSQLADIAYSPAGWALAEQLNFHSDGCYVMQTGYMHEFRRTMAAAPPLKTPIFTYGGKKNGPPFSVTWAGSLLLNRHGPNDGVVCAESAHHPSGNHLGTLELNHIQIHLGRFAWPYVAAAVENRSPELETVSHGFSFAAEPEEETQFLGQTSFGGKTVKETSRNIAVDASVIRMELRIIYTGSISPALRSPSGKIFDDFRADEISGGRTAEISLERPETGLWKLSLNNSEDGGAYFTLVCFYGNKNAALPPEKNADIHLTRRLFQISPDGVRYLNDSEPFGKEIATHSLSDGLYGIETRAEGGEHCPFCRTALHQLAVLPPGAGAKFIAPRRRV